MRILSLLLLLAFSLSLLPARADIYRWVDAQGRVMYGDDPPAKSRAKPVELPMLTVVDGYVPKQQAAPPPPAEEDAQYSDFKITEPVSGAAARANGGNLSVTIGLKPKLKAGDSITLYLDAKQVASDASLSFTLTDVERGEHTVFAVLSDAQGNIIQNTETVTFNVLQAADLSSNQGDNNGTGTDTYQDAQEKLQANQFGRQPQAPTATNFSFPTLPSQ